MKFNLLIGAITVSLFMVGCNQDIKDFSKEYIEVVKTGDINRMIDMSYGQEKEDVLQSRDECKEEALKPLYDESVKLADKSKGNMLILIEKNRLLEEVEPKVDKLRVVYMGNVILDDNLTQEQKEFLSMEFEIKQAKENSRKMKKIISDINKDFNFGGKEKDKVNNIVSLYFMLSNNIDEIDNDIINGLIVKEYGLQATPSQECLDKAMAKSLVKDIKYVSSTENGDKGTAVLKYILKNDGVVELTMELIKKDDKWKVTSTKLKEIK